MAIDNHAIRELILFAENDRKMYDALMNNYLPNLQKKKLAGTYDRAKAVKLLEYYYQLYVRPAYKRLYGDIKLNPAERKVFGKHFADYLHEKFISKIKVPAKKTVKKTTTSKTTKK